MRQLVFVDQPKYGLDSQKRQAWRIDVHRIVLGGTGTITSEMLAVKWMPF